MGARPKMCQEVGEGRAWTAERGTSVTRLGDVREAAQERGYTLILLHASPSLMHGKSRMRKRARTDLCGGRSAMVVPNATGILQKSSGRVRDQNEAARAADATRVCWSRLSLGPFAFTIPKK